MPATRSPGPGSALTGPVPVVLLLGALTVWRVMALSALGINVSFDEAQYWLWAQDPAFGYFSKPPMVAWAIAATTAVCGDGEVCVKLGSSLAHFGAALALYHVGWRLFDRRIGFWSALAYALMPGVSFSSLVITTDPFLLLFWALALLMLVRVREGAGLAAWLGLGLFVGLGLLSKYAMVFFVVSLALSLAWVPSLRGEPRKAGPWLALVVAALCYAPNLWWNWSNDFVSYAHTQANANLGGDLFNPDQLAEFVGSQFGVFGPIFFAVLLWIVIARWRPTVGDERYRLLIAFALPVLAVMTVESLLSRANANWAATAYVAASVLVTAWLLERDRTRLFKAAVALHLVVIFVLHNFTLLAPLAGIEPGSKLDPLKRVRGWDVMGDSIAGLRAQAPDARLLFDDRKTMATLVYYVRPHPFAARMWNPGGAIENHYELEMALGDADVGAGPFLYVTRAEDQAAVTGRFDTAERVAVLRVSLSEDAALTLNVWRLDGFQGYGS
ncbi:MAG: glycosyltransferase family 39 protein [Caenispirillum bisanense]|nr:glycosyltransferase family 39 protein [Caenispirillum bisanense]MCA1972913.1 glycosyltransferase family 39 protein [Caenispirillum sp.]